MDQVLEDYNVRVEYAAMLAPNPDAPESVDAQQTQINFRRRADDVTAALRCRRANRADVLGRLFAAAQIQQQALHDLLRRNPSRGTRGLEVDELVRPITVFVEESQYTWFAELTTAVPYCEWIEESTDNVAMVLVPMLVVWMKKSRVAHQSSRPCQLCR
jgi:hypothetical protein